MPIRPRDKHFWQRYNLRRLLAIFTVAIVLVISSVAIAATTQLKAILLASLSNHTQRITLKFTRTPHYKIFALSKPQRLVIDVTQAKLHANMPTLTHNPLIKKIRRSYKHGYVRIVLDLKVPVSYRAALHRNKHFPPRLIVDLRQHRIPTSIQAKPRTQHKTRIVQKTHSVPYKKPRDVIIVIDAGHGGKDPGAVGKRQTTEKNIVLSIANALRQRINREPGMKAILTRGGNYYVGLRQRLRIARRVKADLFISIHADAYKNRRSNGASVFALSDSGASSEAARWLAEKENKSELLGGVELDHHSSLLRSVLLDLYQTATIRSSLTLGSTILQSLGKVTKLHRGHVEQAGFVVLKSPDIPSALVETGFISNPQEERRLRTAAYRQRLAQAIYTGITNYLFTHPPANTWLAQRRRATRYVVRRGDTLSHIAKQFDVSVKRLLQHNHLKHHHLAVGQRLLVPAIRAA